MIENLYFPQKFLYHGRKSYTSCLQVNSEGHSELSVTNQSATSTLSIVLAYTNGDYQCHCLVQ